MDMEAPVPRAEVEDEFEDEEVESPVVDTLLAELDRDDLTNTSLAQIALRLAQALDDPDTAPGALASVAKELRATITELKAGDERERDLDKFLTGLRAPLRDASAS